MSQPKFTELFDNRWTLRNMLNLFGSVLSFAAIVITACILLSSWTQQRQVKQLELLTNFQNRFDTLYFDKRYDAIEKKRPELFYDPYWSLLHEEYQCWREGFLPPNIFAEWMEYLQRAFKRDESVCGVTFTQSWTKYRDVVGDKDAFRTFIDRVQKGDESAYNLGPSVRWTTGDWAVAAVIITIAVCVIGSFLGYLRWSKWAKTQDISQVVREGSAVAGPAHAPDEPSVTVNPPKTKSK